MSEPSSVDSELMYCSGAFETLRSPVALVESINVFGEPSESSILQLLKTWRFY